MTVFWHWEFEDPSFRLYGGLTMASLVGIFSYLRQSYLEPVTGDGGFYSMFSSTRVVGAPESYFSSEPLRGRIFQHRQDVNLRPMQERMAQN
jgi:hypothetical protein